MAGNRQRDAFAALKYLYARFAGQMVIPPEYSFDNAKPLQHRNAAGTADINTIAVDSNNTAMMFNEAHKPLRKPVTFNLQANGSLGTGGSAGAQTFFIADKSYLIYGISEVHKTAGTDAGAVTLAVTMETGIQAPGTGTPVQTGTFNLKGTANTVQNATLAATPDDFAFQQTLTQQQNNPILLLAGDRLSAVFAGTLTTLAGVVATVTMGPASTSEQAAYYVNSNADLSSQNIIIANRDMIVTGVQAIWATPFGAGITIDITKDTSTNAPGAGTSILSAAMDGTQPANTVVTPALTGTAATLQMAAGDRISVKYSATTTGTGVCIVVTFQSLYGRKEIQWQLGPNAQEQVAQCFFIADRDYEVLEMSEVHRVAAGGAATLKVTIDKGTTAPGGGTAINSANGFNLNATANTVQFGDSSALVLTTVAQRNRLLSAGDRLGLAVSGAAQSIANAVINVSLTPW